MSDHRVRGQPRLLDETLDALKIGVWSWRGEQRLIRYSRTTADLFGLPYDKARHGLPLDRYIKAMHPEDRDRFVDILDRTLAEGGPFLAEYRTVPKPDTERWVLDRGEFERDREGRVVAGRGLVIDITDRLDEEQLKGSAFFKPGFQNLPAIERAVEHALALSELLEGDVVTGSNGDILRALTAQTLKILAGEIASSMDEGVGDQITSLPLTRLH